MMNYLFKSKRIYKINCKINDSICHLYFLFTTKSFILLFHYAVIPFCSFHSIMSDWKIYTIIYFHSNLLTLIINIQDSIATKVTWKWIVNAWKLCNLICSNIFAFDILMVYEHAFIKYKMILFFNRYQRMISHLQKYYSPHIKNADKNMDE